MSRKVALVTGSGQGIGRAIANRLARDGFDVAVNDISQADADRVAAEVEGHGVSSLAVVADVGNRQEVQGMVDAVVARFGRLDVMVSNAGIAQVNPLLEVSEEEFDKIVRVNVKGVLWCAQAAAKVMLGQGGGKIINASSQAGHVGMPLMGAYCSTKFSVRALTQVLARELGPHGITVNAYCPGVVDTGMLKFLAEKVAAYTGASEEATFRATIEQVALGRLQTPEDVANFVSFLASSDSDYVTGQSILADGGMRMI